MKSRSFPFRKSSGRPFSGKSKNTVAGQSRRKHRVESLEGRYLLDGDGLTVSPDNYDLVQNGAQVELAVLANDVFDDDYTGARLITSVSFGSEGGRIDVAGDGQSVLYTPPADFAGTETFLYAIDGEHTGSVSVDITAPLADDVYSVPPDGVTRTLSVLANDPFHASYTRPRVITAVSVASGEGTVAIAADGKSLLYTPGHGAFGDETFTYVVDNLYPARVKIEVPTAVENDDYEAVQHDPPLVMNVLANDPFWATYDGPKVITAVTAGQLGSEIEIAADGKSITYTQPAELEGYSWQTRFYDSFEYVVDGHYSAYVSIDIHRPVVDDRFEVDINSTGFEYRVTENDRYRDRNNIYRDVVDIVTSVTQSENGGVVSISADQLGVVYSPAPGFEGTDTFTYTADGKHEAKVTVTVTRPVRDDHFHSGAYQDSPGRTLNVLSNDFIGNGYTGPRVITQVGQAAEGGTVTISPDGTTVLYTPAAGFVGWDNFTYTVDGELEATTRVRVRALAQNDHEDFCLDGQQDSFVIDVLANDFFHRGYTGPGVITAVEVVSESGQATIEGGGNVRFAPTRDGSHQLRYTVDGQYTATLNVTLRGQLNGDFEVVGQNSATQSFAVMGNDFKNTHYAYCPSYNYLGARVITGVTQSAEGGTVTLAADGRTVNYTPAEDFYGQDSFTYTVDGMMTATVNVEVIRRVRDDVFRVDSADGATQLPVLVNDLFGADYTGPGIVTDVTTSGAGASVAINAAGTSITYTPAAGFAGVDTFVYTVDGRLKAEVSVVVDAPASDQSPQFDSDADYLQFLIDDALVRYEYLFGSHYWDRDYAITREDMLSFDAFPQGGSDRSHSETNVQVAGVDEGDIIEFDANYVYTLNDEGVVIVDAWPAEDLSIESRVDIEGTPLVQYLNGDRLTVISQPKVAFEPMPLELDFIGGGFVDYGLGDAIWYPYEPQPTETFVTVIDVSDRSMPVVVQQTTMEGTYVDSRGVGDYVYVLVNNAEAIGARPIEVDEDGDPNTANRFETVEEFVARVTANAGEYIEAALPNYTSYSGAGEHVRTGLLNTPETVFQPLVENATSLISVVSFNALSDEPGLTDTSAVYSTGAGTIYASLDNFYVLDDVYLPEDGAATRIVKFDWTPETGGVEFAAAGTVAGRTINQFSLDETTTNQGQYLRIATSVSNSNSGNWTGRDENMLFVLQEDDGVLEFVGGMQNLALDEDIRSVRFMGERAFVTTFRNIDPLFALDLSDPANPLAVGHITLPGFTSYMHPLSENHLLTVGQNSSGAGQGPTQVAIFDVSNINQPLRIAEYTFPRFSTSEAQIDHHAFGYYAEHGLLGMPVATTRVERTDEDGDGYSETRTTVRDDLLAVFAVDALATNPADRLQLAAEIMHDSSVRRSGYIGDKLYSMSNSEVKVVDVDALETVIAEVGILPPAVTQETGGELSELVSNLGGIAFISPPQVDPAELATERARTDLANRLGVQSGAPLLVTREATPNAPGGGHDVVFRVAGEHYRYRIGAGGNATHLQDDFEFDASLDAWHAVEPALVVGGEPMAGDFNSDNRVDELDYATWKQSYGAWSLTAQLPADGNGDGVVDLADLSLWRSHLGDTRPTAPTQTGDYNGDGTLDGLDHDFWSSHLGAVSGVGLAADGNGDGVVDAADYTVWRRGVLQSARATSVSVAGDFDGDGGVDAVDHSAWADAFGSGLGSGAASLADYTVWRDALATAVGSSAAASVAPAEALAPAQAAASAELAFATYERLHRPSRRSVSFDEVDVLVAESEASELLLLQRPQLEADLANRLEPVAPPSAARVAAFQALGDDELPPLSDEAL